MIQSKIANQVPIALQALYEVEVQSEQVIINSTRAEFEGDYTVVVFPFTKMTRSSPQELGAKLGEWLQEHLEEVVGFSVVKGFLNLSLSTQYWSQFLLESALSDSFGTFPKRGEQVMIEFSSPNTNKPLHLGHVRNILLGWSTSCILEAFGYEVIKTQIVNDRGIAICRSMLAWKKFAEGATPESTGAKGDHFVGKYYVEFAKAYEQEYKAWQQSEQAQEVFEKEAKEGQDKQAFFKTYKNRYFNEYSALGAEAREMLRKWEAGDPQVRALWAKMNGWVYEGFEHTYERLGVTFDKLYYESDTYLLGKELLVQGLEKGVFQQDGQRIWADLEEANLGTKTIIKSDGTSTYTSQDIGTAHQRFLDFGVRQMIYVVADEQNNHFQVLFELLKRLDEPYAEGLHHLSYGMVDLTTGKMKSREGTVVDADDLMSEVVAAARSESAERGEVADFSPEQQAAIFEKVGLAALKYFILKVNPRKRMTFDPTESVALQGQTGPYIQYSFVRTNGVLERAQKEGVDLSKANEYSELQAAERELLRLLHEYPMAVKAAAKGLDPSEVANYCYDIAKAYSRFWHDLSIFQAENEAAVAFRVELSRAVGSIIQKGMQLLGIEMPQRM